RNDNTALMKSPIRKRLPLMAKLTAEKSGTPPKIPMMGVTMSLTSACTTPVNATPITTATARSTTLPRRMNLRNPLICVCSLQPTERPLACWLCRGIVPPRCSTVVQSRWTHMSDLPIADYALLSDCHSAALVSRSGSVDWFCAPRFDSASLFCRLLDGGGGHWSIHPEHVVDI